MIAALSLCFINLWENNQAGDQAKKVINKLEQMRELESLPDPFNPTMMEVEIDGYLYIGTLEIPALGLSLPVMSEWDYSQLKIAPCRYVGSTKTDNLVIAAHNYESHFGRLKSLNDGDKIFFTDMEGVKNEYIVAAIEILQPTEVDNMNAGDYALTLFTCTYGGASRVTVRCDRVENERELHVHYSRKHKYFRTD